MKCAFQGLHRNFIALSISYCIVESFTYFEYEFFVWDIYYEFSLGLWLAFSLPNGVLWWKESLHFSEVWFRNLTFDFLLLFSFNKSLPNLRWWSCSVVFSKRSIILCTFRITITITIWNWFLCMVCDRGHTFFGFPYGYPLHPVSLSEVHSFPIVL